MESDKDVSPLIQIAVSMDSTTATRQSYPRGTTVWGFRAEPVSTVMTSPYLNLNELKVSTIKNSVPQSHWAHFKGSRAMCGSRLPDWTAQMWNMSFITESSAGQSCFRAWILETNSLDAGSNSTMYERPGSICASGLISKTRKIRKPSSLGCCED